MVRRRHFAWSTALVAVIFLVPLPWITVRQLWTFDTVDRAGCVVIVLLLVAFGFGAAAHAFRGKPLVEIGE